MTDPSSKPTHVRRRCSGHRTDGEPCTLYPIRGGKVCHKHGGSAPHVKAMAAVRAELDRWGLGDTDVDPGKMLLRLLTQSASRAERYALELAALVDEHGGDVPTAMIADAMIVTRDGRIAKAGEYIRGLVQLEAQERDRCATFATKAIAAGLAERQVRLAEKETAIAIAAIHAALDAAGIAHGPERGRALQAAARHLRAVDDLPGVPA